MLLVLRRVIGFVRPEIDTLLEGVRVVFRAVNLQDGALTMLARMPSAPEDVLSVERGVAISGGRLAIIELPVLLGFERGGCPDFLAPEHVELPAILPEPAPVPQGPAEAVPVPFWQAKQRGWTDADLAGTGAGGNYGEGGGRSPRSGLTAAEMALTDPPPRWEALGGQQPAWLLEGFVAPGLNWRPPAAPPADLSAATASDLAPGTIADPAIYAAALRDGTISEIPPDDVAEDAQDAVALSPEDLAALAEFGSREEQERAADHVLALWSAAGAVPSKNKVAYHFSRRADPPLPRLSTAAYDALINQLTADGRAPAAD